MAALTEFYATLPSMQCKYDTLARKNAFVGQTRAEFETWRAEARERLRGLLGLDLMQPCDLRPRCLETVRLPGGITREKILLRTEPDVFMPVYVLVPDKKETNYRLFICLAGHQGAGKASVVGDRTIPAVAASIDRFNYDYGLQLARHGHVVLCPDSRGQGERREPGRQTDADLLVSSCSQLAHMTEPLGMTVAGMLVWDLQRLIDYA